MDQRQQRSVWLWYIALLTVGLLQPLIASAQPTPIGKLQYEKLARTHREYQDALSRGDSLDIAEKCYLMGKRYGAFGDYVTAQKWFFRSLRILEPRGPSELVIKNYLRLAEYSNHQKQYLSAKRYANVAMSYARATQAKHELMSANNVLAGVYELGWQLNSKLPGSVSMPQSMLLDSALYYFHQAEKMAIALKKPYDVAMVYECLGSLLALKDAHQAISYLKKAYLLYIPTKQPYPIINISDKLANSYLKIGQLSEAKKWLHIATTIRDTTGHGDYWQNKNIEETYTKFYKQNGQWKQAFHHQEKYLNLLVQTMNAKREEAIIRAEMQYENQKKEATLKAQQQELELRQQKWEAEQNLARVTALLLGIVCIACLILYWLFRKYHRLSAYNAELIKEQNHRVKNNLQAITNMLGLQFNRLTDAEARQAIEESLLRVEAVALVHQRLYDGDRLAEVNIAQYIPQLVEGALRSFSFGHINPIYTIDPIWLSADIAINIGLLLNELVTNACKYAFPDHPNPVLEIGFQVDAERLVLWFSDNGPGFTPSNQRSSFGMKLIELITEKLKGKHQFMMNTGCRFILSFYSPIEVAV